MMRLPSSVSATMPHDDATLVRAGRQCEHASGQSAVHRFGEERDVIHLLALCPAFVVAVLHRAEPGHLVD